MQMYNLETISVSSLPLTLRGLERREPKVSKHYLYAAMRTMRGMFYNPRRVKGEYFFRIKKAQFVSFQKRTGGFWGQLGAGHANVGASSVFS